MVSFTKALYHFSAALAATLTDPTTIQQEVPVLKKGSLATFVDPVIERVASETEVEKCLPTPVCEPKKKLHRFKQFRPCKKLVAKARKLKAKAKLHFHSLSGKLALKSTHESQVSSTLPVYQLSHGAFDSMIALYEYSPEASLPVFWDESLIFSFDGEEKFDDDSTIVDLDSLKYHQRGEITSRVLKGQHSALTCTRGCFTPYYFSKLFHLFQSLQMYQPNVWGVPFFNPFISITLLRTFQPIKVGLALLFAVRSLVSLSKSPLSTLNSLSSLVKHSRLALLAHSISLILEGEALLTDSAASSDDVSSSKFTERRTLDDAELVYSAFLSWLEVTKELSVSKSTSVSTLAELFSLRLSDIMSLDEESEDEEENIKPKTINEIALTLEEFPQLSSLDNLTSQYYVDPTTASKKTQRFTPAVVSLNKPLFTKKSVGFSEYAVSKSYLKKPKQESPDLTITEAWLEDLAVTFMDATCVGICNEDGYQDKLEHFIAVSQVTFAKLTVAVSEVKAQGLSEFVHKCLSVSKQLGEVYTECLRVSNQFLVIMENCKKAGKPIQFNTAAEKNSAVQAIRWKLENVKKTFGQLMVGREEALASFESGVHPLVDYVLFILLEYQLFFASKTWNPDFALGCSVLEATGKNAFDDSYGKFRLNYWNDAKRATDCFLAEIEDGVRVLDDFSMSMTSLLEVYLWRW